jgi:guanyl-specific ribonuclease Sa/uncharacterized protein YukE
MVDLQEIGVLQSVIDHVAGLQSRVHGLGNPSRLAGDPSALRELASSHHDAATELRDVVARAGSQAVRVTGGGSWAGAASDAFAGFVSSVQGQVEELASRHVAMASALEETAGRAEGLNQQVAEAVAGIESWQQSAAVAVARLDVTAVGPLVSAATTILSGWRALLGEVEAFASSLPRRLDVDLTVRLPPPTGGGSTVDIPLPGRSGIVIDIPLPKGPATVITTPEPRGPHAVITVPLPEAPTIVHETGDEPPPEEIDKGDPPPTESGDEIPPYVGDTLGEIDRTGHAPQGDGRKGGGSFDNDGRDGSEALPRQDADGNPITYREWDVKDPDPIAGRGGERLVTGSDNSAYYTRDHYSHFVRIR